MSSDPAFILVPTAARPTTAPSCHNNIRGALRVLGLPKTNAEMISIDREHLLYDVRVAFKSAIRSAHADTGGSDDASRPIIEAYRIVKRYCTFRFTLPKHPFYEEKARRREASSQL